MRKQMFAALTTTFLLSVAPAMAGQLGYPTGGSKGVTTQSVPGEGSGSGPTHAGNDSHATWTLFTCENGASASASVVNYSGHLWASVSTATDSGFNCAQAGLYTAGIQGYVPFTSLSFQFVPLNDVGYGCDTGPFIAINGYETNYGYFSQLASITQLHGATLTGPNSQGAYTVTLSTQNGAIANNVFVNDIALLTTNGGTYLFNPTIVTDHNHVLHTNGHTIGACPFGSNLSGFDYVDNYCGSTAYCD